MTPEGKVKSKVKDKLKEMGCWSYMPIQNGMGVIGIPDIVACVPVKISESMVGKTIGVFAGIECKAEGKLKNTTPNQRRILYGIGTAMGVAVVADQAETVAASVSWLRATGETTVCVPE